MGLQSADNWSDQLLCLTTFAGKDRFACVIIILILITITVLFCFCSSVLIFTRTDCPTPVKPSHGEVTFTGTTVGSQADYECDTGYTMGGNPQLKCLATGTWDDLPPDCVGEYGHV